MRTIEIFVNDKFYKTITVQENSDGSYNPADILEILNEDKRQGLLDQYQTPDGKLVLKMSMSYSVGPL